MAGESGDSNSTAHHARRHGKESSRGLLDVIMDVTFCRRNLSLWTLDTTKPDAEPVSRSVVWGGAAGYSDFAVTSNGKVMLLYEAGNHICNNRGFEPAAFSELHGSSTHAYLSPAADR